MEADLRGDFDRVDSGLLAAVERGNERNANKDWSTALSPRGRMHTYREGGTSGKGAQGKAGRGGREGWGVLCAWGCVRARASELERGGGASIRSGHGEVDAFQRLRHAVLACPDPNTVSQVA
eukprot:428232-Rhodomonas_salina.3